MNSSVQDCAESGLGCSFNGIHSRSDSYVFQWHVFQRILIEMFWVHASLVLKHCRRFFRLWRFSGDLFRSLPYHIHSFTSCQGSLGILAVFLGSETTQDPTLPFRSVLHSSSAYPADLELRKGSWGNSSCIETP